MATGHEVGKFKFLHCSDVKKLQLNRQKEIKYCDFRATTHGFYVNVNKYYDTL